MTPTPPPRPVYFAGFRFEPGNGLFAHEAEVPLPPRALAVLAALIAQPGVVVSKQALLDAAWPEAFVTDASLLEAIRVLREALGDDRTHPRFVQTVHRRGYRFVAPLTAAPEPLSPAIAPAIEPPACLTVASEPTVDPRGAVAAPREAPVYLPFVAAGFAGTVATVGIAMVFALFGQRPLDVRPTMRFAVTLPDELAIDSLGGALAVSRDGLQVAYVAVHDGRARLVRRTAADDTAQPIAGSEGARDPFFSPDGEWIGFFADSRLKKLRVGGGTPITIATTRVSAGATWLDDGSIVFGGGPGGGLAQVGENGGAVRTLVAPSPGSPDVSYGWPDVLPDGDALLFTAITVSGSRVAVLDRTRGSVRTLIDAAAFARYAPTGHLVFERRGRLEAAAFSATTRRVVTPPRPVLQGLATSGALTSGPRFGFSRTGALYYVPAALSDGGERLHWLDLGGELEAVPLPSAPIVAADVSPDLEQLALSVETETGADLWVGDLRRGAVSRLRADGQSASPTWRPDGLEIAFAFSKAGPFNLFVRSADADTPPERLLAGPWNQVPTSWSRDGRWIAFTEFQPMTGADIWLLDVRTRERRQLVRTVHDESHARFSPDGQWVAYMSNEGGRWGVFIQPSQRSRPRVQVSTEGGAWPAWAVDGRTLYFTTNGRTAAVTVDTTRELRVSAPTVISGRDDLELATGRADTGRVLVRQRGTAPLRHELRIVLEWFAELTRLTGRPS